jgi:hypothetical protein
MKCHIVRGIDILKKMFKNLLYTKLTLIKLIEKLWP